VSAPQVCCETVRTDPAFPDDGPASRLTKLSGSVDLSGGFSLDIFDFKCVGTTLVVDLSLTNKDRTG